MLNYAIQDRINRVIADALELPLDNITPGKNLTDLDSSGVLAVEVFMKLDEEFAITIPEAVYPKLNRVQDIYDYFEKNVALK